MAADGGGAGLTYEFADYDELRSMSAGAGKPARLPADALVRVTNAVRRRLFSAMGCRARRHAPVGTPMPRLASGAATSTTSI